MQIYNTLNRKKEEFIPSTPNEVKMYVCGPTVYDYFHIGNARSFIIADTISKYFRYRGMKVKFVMNLTDVDDKIIKKANEQNVESKEVAEVYSTAFFEDLVKLGVTPSEDNFYPKATEHMSEIIDMIKKIEEKGHAYNVNGNVFFDVRSFKGYGKLSGKNLDDLESGARVEINTEKKNPLDFALWKKAKDGEPYWESPWGNGRPGWHIECSAMSTKHLGESIDIHAGGNDLIFPHHENEIAQSEAANSKEFVKYWMHFGFLNIDNQKMSKSLGNFFTARELLKKYPYEALRMLYMQTHYRGPLNFSQELIEAAHSGVKKIYVFRNKLLNIDKSGESIDMAPYYEKFNSAMDDDFNSAKAIATIFEVVNTYDKLANTANLSKEGAEAILEFLDKIANGVLGIYNPENGLPKKVSGEKFVKLLVDFRFAEKQNKNFAIADKIRDFLADLGVTLLDSKEGSTFEISDDSFGKLTDETLVNFFIDERAEAKANKDFGMADKIRDFLKEHGVILQDGKDGTTFTLEN